MTSKSPNRLTVTKEQLAEAARSVGLGPLQADAMWANLASRTPAPSSFSAAQVAWYFGAAVILAAMGWLISIVGSAYGAGALLAMSLAYTAAFTYGGWNFASQRDLRVPGGLLYMVATVMTPVTVAAAGEAFNVRLTIDAEMTVPFAALAAIGLLYASATRISFVVLPALLGGWFAAVSGAAWLFPGSGLSWEVVSVFYGAAVLLGSFLLDLRSDEDYSFWGYGIGALAVFGGLTFAGKSDAAYALYALGGVASMVVSVLLARRVFAFAGAAAVLVWLGYLSLKVENSAFFALALTALGVATIYGGVLYHRNADRIEAAILRLVPAGLRERLPRR